jgi:hypothetical protein
MLLEWGGYMCITATTTTKAAVSPTTKKKHLMMAILAETCSVF